ncbi:hypothetical protein DFJ58DRAFT_848017 [Suillus subalutaceus]|uniref:uncharacterized protein n=1 Tax=Suillus subalutaceus TaxID=48586 RepID=UPI001B866AB6|nr:uncharacterized protein DFJ58DRAFT_848017 [Suillus subalutaceus]KAG1832352.1 hypothetical protein DFJ58DRAFT_848017 [Suillus subalutaceus]
MQPCPLCVTKETLYRLAGECRLPPLTVLTKICATQSRFDDFANRQKADEDSIPMNLRSEVFNHAEGLRIGSIHPVFGSKIDVSNSSALANFLQRNSSWMINAICIHPRHTTLKSSNASSLLLLRRDVPRFMSSQQSLPSPSPGFRLPPLFLVRRFWNVISRHRLPPDKSVPPECSKRGFFSHRVRSNSSVELAAIKTNHPVPEVEGGEGEGEKRETVDDQSKPLETTNAGSRQNFGSLYSSTRPANAPQHNTVQFLALHSPSEEAPTSDALHPSTAAHVQSDLKTTLSTQIKPLRLTGGSLRHCLHCKLTRSSRAHLQIILGEPECERKLLEETEEKLVTRLGITYRVLRRLGFSQDIVDECLRAIQGVDLEEAYEWLYTYCSEDELEERVAEDLDDSKVPRRKRKELQSPTSRSPLPSSTPLPLSPVVTAASKLDANALVFVPARHWPASDLDLLKSRDIHPAESTRSSPSRSSSPDIDDLVAEGKPAPHCDPVLVQRLQDKLMALKSHYFFNEKDAETQYRSERARVDALLLQSRLRESSPELSVAQEKKVAKPLNAGPCVEKQDIHVPSDIPDIFDQHEEGLGSMLEILDTLPSEIAGEGGTIIRIRDMILPKHWSSKTPKTLLAEFVFKVDRIVSGPSRAKRACVTVNWEGGKMDEWNMRDVACHNDIQAEYYVATLALHALTFPATDGFAVGSSGALANHTSFRLLPPFKMEKNTRVTTEAKDPTPVRLPPRNDTGSDHIIADFRTRQMRPAYQEMLYYHRKQLPIAKYRDDIQSTLDHSQILVLSGETGCDKSTQIPAFILEDQLAVASLARYTARNRDSVGAIGTSSLLVGYSIRLESNTTRNTRLAFVTNAIEYADWSTQENSPINLHNKSHKNRNRNRFDWDEDTVYGNDDEETLVDGGQQNSSQSMRLEKRYSYQTINTVNLLDERAIPYELILHLLERLCFEDKERHHFSAGVLIFMPGLGEIRRMNDLLTEHHAFGDENSFRHQQTSRVEVDTPPSWSQLTVLRFDEKRQLSRLVETFVAKSNAAQRRGRAGQLADHPLPEMMRFSLSDLALHIKIMKVKIGTSIADVLSRALDPPTPVNVQRVISALVRHASREFLAHCGIVPMSGPRSNNCCCKSPFTVPMGMEQEADRAKSSFCIDNSDFLTINNAFSSWRRASENLSFLVSRLFVCHRFIRELGHARFGRNRTRFVNVSLLLDSNGPNIALISSALTAGLYPKVLAIDSSSGQMCTISNNQFAAFHPTSVNFGRKPADFGVHHLVYFTLMHSKKMYAWKTGPIDDLAIVLLCGESEFKHYTQIHSNMLSIDRKTGYQLAAKANVVLKILCNNFELNLSTKVSDTPLGNGSDKFIVYCDYHKATYATNM